MSKELLFESDRTKIILAENTDLGRHVLKILNIEYPTQQQIKQFFSEYEILREIDLPLSRKVHKAEKLNDQYVISLEYVKGETLKEWSEIQRSLEDQLLIAIQITKALAELHEKNIIHRDLSNTNILVDNNRKQVRVIDFGFASKFNTKVQHLGNPEHLLGTLPYISPEQTGRMNRQIDYRTDLYSLGVILFEIFTGRLPFEMQDPLNLVHAHIAISPPDPKSIVESLPDVLSAIILRLLSKNAESRYDSALGLASDLEKCLDHLKETGSIEYFKIQQNDFSGRFIINQKLYGRDDEINTLFKTFEYVSTGPSELVLVAGYSGTGKSSLVHEIHKPVTEKRGLFLEGKFDQYQRGLPYFAIIQALESFVNILLSEDENSLNRFRETIQKALGEEGKVLTDIIHPLELIIGKQPVVAEVGGTEAQNRFNYVFRKFINSISTEDHPVVLFIDDVQWSDSGSLDLISSIMTDNDNQYFMCICAYRDNEVSASHPFTRTVEELRLARVAIQEITLQNLTFANVDDLISDSLNLDKSETKSLTELVHGKTGGNAFFVNQFLKSLYEEEHLEFNFESKRWVWNIDRIKSQNLTDDVVSLMTGKINRLPENAKKTMKLAACVGASFELSILAYIAEKNPEICEADLESALAEGLIQETEEAYSFAHDRIQQAAYSFIPELDRPPVHHQIGVLLMDQLTPAELEDRLFDVVNQLNLGVNMITSEEEKEKLCDLNLKAGIKAMEASAFESSLSYLQSGIHLLPENGWIDQYQRSLQLYTQAAEAAFLSSQFEDMETYIKHVETNGTDILDKLKSLEIRIHAMKAKNKLVDALNEGLKLLEQLGEKLPTKPSKIQLVSDLVKTMASLRGMTDEKILNLPVATDPRKAAAMRICAVIAPSAYWANPDVFPFTIWRLMRLSIKYGNTPVSSFGYSTHGIILVGIFNQFKAGNRFGNLGLKVLNKLKAKEWVTQVYTAVYALIVLWNEHIEKTLKPLQESYHIGLETGAIEFACVNANIYCIHSYFLGRPLAPLELETKSFSENFKGYKQGTNHKYNEIYRQSMLNMMGQSENPTVLTGDALDEGEVNRLNEENNDRTGSFFVFFNKMILHYHFGEYTHAWKMAQKGRVLLDAVLAKAEVVYFHFYEGLTAAAIIHHTLDANNRTYIKQLKKNIGKLKSWGKSAPMNFQHKYHLLQGEYFRIRKQRENAKEAYEAAIHGSVQSRYTNDEALTYERVADFYASMQNDQLQNFYLNKAFQTFQEWGAGGVMEYLLGKYPHIIYTDRKRKQASGTQSGSSYTGGVSIDQDIDISSILRASTSISQEIVLSKLLQRMMTILIENLGATKGCLTLIENAQLMIGIITDNTGRSDHILENLPMKGSELVPEKVIAYTRRTREQLVFENIQTHASFSSDPYVINNQPKSAISFPIMHQGNMRGILYFENDLAEGAFTKERIQLLTLLSGQISTSLDNALLYENLENKVIERTSQLAEEKKKSDELLLNILPERTAEELKLNGFAKPKRFESISVMFTDFKDFTKISSSMSPEDVVNIIDTYFRKFDEVSEKYGIEKIKTIGDSYMCASGMNGETDHAKSMINAAFEIKNYMEQQKIIRSERGVDHFPIRIGIHSGPVVAGVVGSKKFAYDIWGDTVNTASRMETNCGPWNINISGETYNLIKENFECFHRGKIEAKNKGKIDMYYVLEKI